MKNVRTIYRGINPTHTTVVPDDSIIHLGYVGRLVSLKWVDILLQGFSECKKSYTWLNSLKLSIVWDGPERKHLEHLAQSLGIASSVEFLWQRSVEEIRSQFLPSFHIFINPSFQEWLPTTVIEALIAWARVIATDVWWTREILRHAQFLLIAPRSKMALANAIDQNIHSITESNTSRIPVSLFTWEQTFREFREVYDIFL